MKQVTWNKWVEGNRGARNNGCSFFKVSIIAPKSELQPFWHCLAPDANAFDLFTPLLVAQSAASLLYLRRSHRATIVLMGGRGVLEATRSCQNYRAIKHRPKH
jgi:hypothetical protein